MAKTIFEQMGGTYTMQGDYYLPDLTLPAEEERPIGVWVQRHRQYLKQHHKILYYNLLTSGKLFQTMCFRFFRFTAHHKNRAKNSDQQNTDDCQQYIKFFTVSFISVHFFPAFFFIYSLLPPDGNILHNVCNRRNNIYPLSCRSYS